MRIFVRKPLVAPFMKNLVVSTLVSAILVACSNPSHTSTRQANNIPARPEEGPPQTAVNADIEEDVSVTVKFNAFSLEIIGFYAEDEDDMLSFVQQDSVFIWGVYGQTIEGRTIHVIGYEALEDLNIEQRYTTSVSISEEGECCELRYWKHYNSPWKTLRPIGKGVFQCLEYTRKEHEQFPQVNMAELKTAAKDHCGAGWPELLEQVNRPQDPPSNVDISNFFLRIRGSKDGKPFVKLIEIGCQLRA